MPEYDPTPGYVPTPGEVVPAEQIGTMAWAVEQSGLKPSAVRRICKLYGWKIVGHQIFGEAFRCPDLDQAASILKQTAEIEPQKQQQEQQRALKLAEQRAVREARNKRIAASLRAEIDAVEAKLEAVKALPDTAVNQYRIVSCQAKLVKLIGQLAAREDVK